MFGLSPVELLVIGSIAVLLFGNRLPSVAKSLGASLQQFKNGMQGIEREVRGATSSTNYSRPARFDDIDDRDESTAPKFEPPTSAPAPPPAATPPKADAGGTEPPAGPKADPPASGDTPPAAA